MKPKPHAQNASNSTRESVPGFSFSNVGSYADKDELLEKGLVFTISSLEFQPGQGFEGADRWAVIAELDGRPDEILTFSCNEKRDEQLRAAQAHIEAHGPIANVRLKKSGKAYYLETVDSAQ